VAAIREELANQRAALAALAPAQATSALRPAQQSMSAGAYALAGTTAFTVAMTN